MPSYGKTTGSTEQVGETLSWTAPVIDRNFSGGSWVQGLNSEQHTYGGDWATLKAQAASEANSATFKRRYTATLTRMAGGHCELVTQWQDYVWVSDNGDGSEEDTPGSSEDNPVTTLTISASQESILTSAIFTEGEGKAATAEQLALYKMISEGASLSTVVIYDNIERTLTDLIADHSLDGGIVSTVQKTPSYYVPRVECEVSWRSSEMLEPTVAFKIEAPTGLEKLELGDRNWLYLGGSSQSVEVQADEDGETVLMYNNVKKYLLSGVGGWDTDIYGSSKAGN